MPGSKCLFNNGNIITCLDKYSRTLAICNICICNSVSYHKVKFELVKLSVTSHVITIKNKITYSILCIRLSKFLEMTVKSNASSLWPMLYLRGHMFDSFLVINDYIVFVTTSSTPSRPHYQHLRGHIVDWPFSSLSNFLCNI